MYSLVPGKRFKKSLKRIAKSGKYDISAVQGVVEIILSKQKLAQKYKNHFLSGELSDFEECHIHGDLLLIYKKHEIEQIIFLYDIGTHSDLFE
jgi:mRNA interferase YafQ